MKPRGDGVSQWVANLGCEGSFYECLSGKMWPAEGAHYVRDYLVNGIEH